MFSLTQPIILLIKINQRGNMFRLIVVTQTQGSWIPTPGMVTAEKD
jgi:hypothetical protein